MNQLRLRMGVAGIVVAIAATVLAACGTSNDARSGSSGPTAAKAPTPGLLFVVESERATARSGTGGSAITLTMGQLEPDMTWFSDRPGRQVGHGHPIDLVYRWKTFGFASDPPNAALEFRDPAARKSEQGVAPRRVAVVELLSATYTKGRLTFSGRIDSSDAAARRAIRGAAAHATKLPARMTDVSLFIDDAQAAQAPATTSVVLYDKSGATSTTIWGDPHLPSPSPGGTPTGGGYSGHGQIVLPDGTVVEVEPQPNSSGAPTQYVLTTTITSGDSRIVTERTIYLEPAAPTQVKINAAAAASGTGGPGYIVSDPH